jgi:hypothetical protein
MLMVVDDTCRTSNPTARRRASATRMRASSEVKLTTWSWVMGVDVSNIDTPPMDRGEASA